MIAGRLRGIHTRNIMINSNTLQDRVPYTTETHDVTCDWIGSWRKVPRGCQHPGSALTPSSPSAGVPQLKRRSRIQKSKNISKPSEKPRLHSPPPTAPILPQNAEIQARPPRVPPRPQEEDPRAQGVSHHQYSCGPGKVPVRVRAGGEEHAEYVSQGCEAGVFR